MEETIRDNQFLEKKLETLWQRYFSDVKRKNQVKIKFGPRVSRRMGSIRKVHHAANSAKFDTLILLNGHFRDPEIPEMLIDATICHELAHYAHGFSSPLPRLLRFPHRGGVVDREFKKRGLSRLINTEKRWLEANWLKYLKTHKSTRKRTRKISFFAAVRFALLGE